MTLFFSLIDVILFFVSCYLLRIVFEASKEAGEEMAEKLNPPFSPRDRWLNAFFVTATVLWFTLMLFVLVFHRVLGFVPGNAITLLWELAVVTVFSVAIPFVVVHLGQKKGAMSRGFPIESKKPEDDPGKE